MLGKIKKFFFRNAGSGKKIIINCEDIEDRVALLEDGSLEEYNLERTNNENIVGGIFKGVVKNIEPGLKAMFIDIGYEKNAFLHFWDAVPGALDNSLEEVSRKKKKKKKKRRITARDIPNIYPVGSEILIQVTKGAIGNKGPRVTTRITLPGRFLVLLPLNEQFGISRKIDNVKERKRLRKIIEKMDIPDETGLIMRTACQGQKIRYFIRDYQILIKQWEEITDKRNNLKSPCCVFKEPSIIDRVVRDFLTDKIDEIICDNIDKVNHMKDIVSQISKRSQKRITHYAQKEPIFVKYRVQDQLDNAFHRQVWLECGGYIIIDETEALIAIDVNTGRNKGGENVNKMILETNLDAAKEITRQLRLRNMGGLIVIDFIDMRSKNDQYQVYKTMKERVYNDKAKTQVTPISQLGLMEMTRQRLNESLSNSLYETCEACSGKGFVKSATTMSAELQQKIKIVMTRYKTRHKDIIITVHPDVIHRLKTEDDKSLVDLERKLEGKLTFKSNPTFNRERIEFEDAQTGESITV